MIPKSWQTAEQKKGRKEREEEGGKERQRQRDREFSVQFI